MRFTAAGRRWTRARLRDLWNDVAELGWAIVNGEAPGEVVELRAADLAAEAVAG